MIRCAAKLDVKLSASCGGKRQGNVGLEVDPIGEVVPLGVGILHRRIIQYCCHGEE